MFLASAAAQEPNFKFGGVLFGKGVVFRLIRARYCSSCSPPPAHPIQQTNEGGWTEFVAAYGSTLLRIAGRSSSWGYCARCGRFYVCPAQFSICAGG